MVFRRACMALLSLGLALSAGSRVTAQAAKKKPVAAAKKATAGAVRRAPAAKPFNAKKGSSKKGGAKLARGKAKGRMTVAASPRTVASVSHASTTASTTLYAPGAVPVEGREAAITRITESLASQRAGIEGAANLQPFFDQLRALETDPARRRGAHSAIRRPRIRRRTPSRDRCVRFFRTSLAMVARDIRIRGIRLPGTRFMARRRAQSTGWTITGTHFRDLGDGMLGMGGVSLGTEQPGNWISLDADATSLEVQYLVEPDGGDIEVYDGDQMLQHISTAGPTAAGTFRRASRRLGRITSEVRTTTYAPVRLFGMVTEASAGVTYESMGLNGAEAGLILKWNEVLQQELMAQRDVALIVLALWDQRGERFELDRGRLRGDVQKPDRALQAAGAEGRDPGAGTGGSRTALGHAAPGELDPVQRD